jgi:hypothetical protein
MIQRQRQIVAVPAGHRAADARLGRKHPLLPFGIWTTRFSFAKPRAPHHQEDVAVGRFRGFWPGRFIGMRGLIFAHCSSLNQNKFALIGRPPNRLTNPLNLNMVN